MESKIEAEFRQLPGKPRLRNDLLYVKLNLESPEPVQTTPTENISIQD